MNCQNCGQPLEPGAAFCANCGQQVSAPVQQPVTPAVAAQPQVAPHITQVYNNQPQMASPAPGFNNMVPAGVGQAAMPANYKDPAEHSAELKGIIGIILGVIGIPGSIIPIIGLVLGISGVVLGTMSRSKYKHLVSLLAIIFSIIAILASLGFWVYNIEHSSSLKTLAGGTNSNAPTSTAGLTSISTPCYSVMVDKGLQNYAPNGCNFDAASTTEEFAVDSLSNPNINSSNIAQAGKVSLDQGIKDVNGTVTNEGISQFAGSPAYVEYATVQQGNVTANAVFAFVLHKTSEGNNIFIIGRTVQNSKVSFGPLESTWQWK